MGRKRGGLGMLLACLVGFWILRALLPALAGVFGFLLWAAAIGFVVLLGAIIISGLKSGEKEAQKPAEGETKALTFEQKKAVDDTKALLNKIRINSVRVNDTQIRNDFIDICNATEKIINYLKDDPTDFQTGRRVINYYTSSVAEIESKYVKLQNSGTDMGNTSEKLKGNLEEIKGALNKLYQNLFDDDKLDLTVEMKALSIALKRDGLVDDSFAKIAQDFASGKATEEQILAQADVIEDVIAKAESSADVAHDAAEDYAKQTAATAEAAAGEAIEEVGELLRNE